MEKKLYNGQRVWETVKDLTGLNTDWLSAIIKMPAGGYDELWKKTFVFGELDSIVFFNPELYAACDKNKRVKVTSHFVLPQEGSVGKKNTILPDIVFYLPQIDDSNEPLICTIEQQHKNDSTLASRFFKAVNRLMSQNSIKSVTGFIAYTGTYNGTNEIENDCFSLKYHLTFPKHHILSYKLKDLQEDKRRFARILEAWIYYTDYRKIISRYGALIRLTLNENISLTNIANKIKKSELKDAEKLSTEFLNYPETIRDQLLYQSILSDLTLLRDKYVQQVLGRTEDYFEEELSSLSPRDSFIMKNDKKAFLSYIYDFVSSIFNLFDNNLSKNNLTRDFYMLYSTQRQLERDCFDAKVFRLTEKLAANEAAAEAATARAIATAKYLKEIGSPIGKIIELTGLSESTITEL